MIGHQELKMEEPVSRGRKIKTKNRGSITLTQGGPWGDTRAHIKPLDFLKV
jgi:hypothetical protein